MDKVRLNQILQESLDLLKHMIEIQSFSKEEDEVADLIYNHFIEKDIEPERLKNNIWIKNKYFNSDLPTLLLNSHMDTVKPTKGWLRDPFVAAEENGRIYGLGSNDAGASLVALIGAFKYLNEKQLMINLVLCCSAEEEITGPGGMRLVFPYLPKIDYAIVGEPTKMEAAIAERGLIVIDGEAHGKPGHAARDEGVNALYIALEDINSIRNFKWGVANKWLGKTKATVTQIQAGTQHNVVPSFCKYVIDVRPNGEYSNEEITEKLRSTVSSELTPRSLHLQSSLLSDSHVLFSTARKLNLKIYGSPTLSDMSVIPVPALKMGCGDSARSHTADEYIVIEEISSGLESYIKFINVLNAESKFN
jgi:acetylornithine deacetylase